MKSNRKQMKKEDCRRHKAANAMAGKLLAALAMVVCLSGCGAGGQKITDTAMTALSQQNYQEALTGFEQALLAGEDALTIYRGMGLAYMGQGMYGKAITSFKKALGNAGMFPGDTEFDINYYMAICYYKLEEYEAAIQVYDGIIALEPKAVDAYFLRGSMKLYLADVDGAKEDFNQAVQIDKNDYGKYIDVYDCMMQHGYREEAQEYLDQVLMADHNKISDYDKGRLAYYEGDYEQACNYLERVRANNDVNTDIIAFLGECYQKQEKYSYAVAVYSGYVEKNPNPEIYNKMGLCYIEDGDYQNALLSFQAGQNIQENNTCMQTLKLNEIACYEYMHDFKSARDKLAEYLSVYPSTPELQKEYAFLTTR